MESVPVDAHDIGWWIGRERRSGQLADGLELLGRTPAEAVDASPSPIGWAGELGGKADGVSPSIPNNEVLGDRVDHRSGLWDDDELSLWVAGLNLASSGDVGVDVIAFVDIADDPDLWFVLEKAIDEAVQIGIPEVVVEHPDREFEVLILRFLIPTVLSKAGEKAEFEPVQSERVAMEERNMVCLSCGSDFASSTGG